MFNFESSGQFWPPANVKYTVYRKKHSPRIFKKNTNYFYAVRISVPLAILSEICVQVGYFL